jgi:hypothetical protein
MGAEYFLVCGTAQAWMEFAEALCVARVPQRVLAEKIFCLVLKVIETGVCGELFRRHRELPFVYPRSA